MCVCEAGLFTIHNFTIYIYICYHLLVLESVSKAGQAFQLIGEITIPRYFETPCLIYALLPLDLLRAVSLRKRARTMNLQEMFPWEPSARSWLLGS